MNKILFTTAALLLATVMVRAQQPLIAYSTKSTDNRTVATPAVKSESMASLQRKNIKIYNDFTSRYGTAVDADIVEMSNVTMVIFTNAGILTRMYYKPSGIYNGSIRYYDESLLPIEEARTIKQAYPAYSIFGVVELTTTEKTVYMVKIQNEKYWKTVQVDGDEITVTEQFKK